MSAPRRLHPSLDEEAAAESYALEHGHEPAPAACLTPTKLGLRLWLTKHGHQYLSNGEPVFTLTNPPGLRIQAQLLRARPPLPALRPTAIAAAIAKRSRPQ